MHVNQHGSIPQSLRWLSVRGRRLPRCLVQNPPVVHIKIYAQNMEEQHSLESFKKVHTFGVKVYHLAARSGTAGETLVSISKFYC